MVIFTRDQLKEIKEEIFKDFKAVIEKGIGEIMDSESFTDKLIAKVSDTVQKTLETKLNNYKQHYEKQIKTLEEKIDAIEQYSRRKNLRIFGVPENPVIPLKDDINNIFTTMGTEPKPIVECYRIGKLTNKPRAIFLKLANYEDKMEIIKNRKKLKGTKVHIKEDLTKAKMEILTAASDKFGYKNVWSLNGKIYVMLNNKKTEFKSIELVDNYDVNVNRSDF
ncbi:unnamed protein product [Brassicogethes aeneus]|uniref:Uncharacterized protein n=1 Tax=Brassicogethes aeneus TaxID=1431903 RepID=A0A9P0FCL2_BRAAE|nr:unnamed protein product [Brassicogethes aeneus]